MKHILIILILLSTCGLSSQQVSPLLIEYEPGLFHSFINQSGKIRLLFPAFKSNDNVVLVSPLFRFYEFDNSIPAQGHYFANFGAQITWIRKINQNWKQSLFVATLFSNTEFDTNWQIWRTGVQFIYRKNDNLNFITGLAYMYRQGCHTFAPVAGLRWNIKKNINLACIIPLHLKLSIRPGENFEYGLLLAGEGFNSPVTNNSNDYFEIRNRCAGIFNNFKIFSNFWLNTFYFYKLSNNISFYNSVGETNFRIFYKYVDTAPSSWYSKEDKGLGIKLSLVYRFQPKINKEKENSFQSTDY